MLINNEKRNRKVSIITDNEYLKLGLLSILSELDPKSFVGNAIFIDVDSLKLMSDFGILLKNAYANRASVILICSGGDMSMVLERLPHIDINEKLALWPRDITTLLRSNLTYYFIKEFNDLICVKKLGAMKMAIILMVNKGWTFSLIARTLKISHKTLYRYTGGLVSYFNVKNINFLFYFLRSRFPPSYFDSRLTDYSPRAPLLSFVAGKVLAKGQTRITTQLTQP